MSFFYGMARAKEAADGRNHEKEMAELKFEQQLELQRRQFAHARAMAASRGGGGGSRGGGRRGGGGGSSLSKDEKKRVEDILDMSAKGVRDDVLVAADSTDQVSVLAQVFKEVDEDYPPYVKAINETVTTQMENSKASINEAVGNVMSKLHDPESLVDEAALGLPDDVITDEASPVNNLPTPESTSTGIYPDKWDLSARPVSPVDTSRIANTAKETALDYFDGLTAEIRGDSIIIKDGSEEDKRRHADSSRALTDMIVDDYGSGKSYNDAVSDSADKFRDLYELGGGVVGLDSLAERVGYLNDYGIYVGVEPGTDNEPPRLVAPDGSTFVPPEIDRYRQPIAGTEVDMSPVQVDMSSTVPSVSGAPETAPVVVPTVETGTLDVAPTVELPTVVEGAGPYTMGENPNTLGTYEEGVTPNQPVYTTIAPETIDTNNGPYRNLAGDVPERPAGPGELPNMVEPEPVVAAYPPSSLADTTAVVAPVVQPAQAATPARATADNRLPPLTFDDIVEVDPTDPASVIQVPMFGLGVDENGRVWRRYDAGLYEIKEAELAAAIDAVDNPTVGSGSRVNTRPPFDPSQR